MDINKVRKLIFDSKYLVAFTGAGISVESGIPPFRGENGIWNKYNPEILELNYFLSYPEKSWREIVKMFYEVVRKARPNAAHKALAILEKKAILKSIITQNIDNLHFDAGNKNVIEFHGNTRDLICLDCKTVTSMKNTNLDKLPPRCNKCGGLLKPDFIFFGEPIPSEAFSRSFQEAKKSDVMLVIGTTGVIMPASTIPIEAKNTGATIIEINIEPTNYTNTITDIFLQGKATEIMSALTE